MPADDTANFSLEDVTVRLAGKDDCAAIIELFEKSLLEGQVRENDTGADIENLEEAYFSDNGASGFWVAIHKDAVVGMIGVQRTSEHMAEMRRLRVREGYRRRGVGSILMEHATRFCRQHGYLKVILDVRVERNPAISMFEKFGFTLSRTREFDDHRVLDFFLNLYSPEPGD